VLNGTVDPYNNPGAAVHFVSAAGGNGESMVTLRMLLSLSIEQMRRNLLFLPENSGMIAGTGSV
jgi:hypothetical protein